MSLSAIDEATITFVEGGFVAILTASWHEDLVDSMANSCARVLRKHGVDQIEFHRVPGTLELPLGASVLLDSNSYDAIVCLGVVEKGSTAHFDMITHATSSALQNIAIENRAPVINEIIAVYDIADAVARASDDEFNKGIEAAAAALDMIKFMRQNV